MIVCGIDPGYHRVGWGFVERVSGRTITAKSWGCVETNAKEDLPERLMQIHQEIFELLKKNKPDFVVMEKLYFAQSVTTALKVSEARGVLLLATAELKIPVLELTNSQIKSGFTGFGGAKKFQMQEMVRLVFGMKEKITPDDAADGLAMAYVGASRMR
ncbi:MAG: crossover junction endodeoxyribonuclease RuvC [Candidatus Magasanikbacteria bacterium]|nr:crossover junction endodeoxyribonuclease RuvC [Candidatus Magasanikbacteria bacterium]